MNLLPSRSFLNYSNLPGSFISQASTMTCYSVRRIGSLTTMRGLSLSMTHKRIHVAVAKLLREILIKIRNLFSYAGNAFRSMEVARYQIRTRMNCCFTRHTNHSLLRDPVRREQWFASATIYFKKLGTCLLLGN